MRHPNAILLALLVIAVGHGFARAVDLPRAQQIQILNQAQQSFEHGERLRGRQSEQAASAFTESAHKFQLLIDAGIRNGKLHYNLGNAWLEAGQLGPAILNYRRAQRLIPGDGALEANLNYARSLCANQIAPSGHKAFVQTLFFWHYQSSLRVRYWMAIATFAGFWTVMILRVYVRRVRWRYVLIPLGLITIVLAVSVAADFAAGTRHAEGVLVVDNVMVRKGNGEGFEPQFDQPLHQGVEFKLLERRNDWLRIELPDGQNGWVRTAQAELI